ncbi:MAG: hypothetical protein R3Y28_03620 [Candidatus Gastranaerophilales bacterium]
MLKRIKYIDEETKNVLTMNANSNEAWAVQNGYSIELYDVEQSEIDDSWYITGYAPMYSEEELGEQEARRIGLLNLTRGDVFRGLYNAKGVTRESLRANISEAEITETFSENDKELALIDFDEAINFYRGNGLVDVVGLQLGITAEQMNEFFETGDYTSLT